MKIAILTLPLQTNYGGILQAYALQTVLERMGHEVEVIKIKSNGKRTSLFDDILSIIKQCVKRYILGRKVRINKKKYRKEVKNTINRDIKIFIKSYIHEIKVDNFQTLAELKYDAYVVGSDQIWRNRYFAKLLNYPMENAFLSFTKGKRVKRIAYAPSFGTDDWEYSPIETQKCAEMLKIFNAVSVREKDGVILCNSKFGVKANHVLDPTMLLLTSDYIKLADINDTPLNTGKLLTYILDKNQDKMECIDKIAKAKKLQPFSIIKNIGFDEDIEPEKLIQPSVEHWLRAFYDSDFVVTDSFHACVFSILFKKEFVVIGNKDRGLSRINSLLEMFGLEDRMVCDSDQFIKLGDIDYEIVYSKLKHERAASLNFLHVALNS